MKCEYFTLDDSGEKCAGSDGKWKAMKFVCNKYSFTKMLLGFQFYNTVMIFGIAYLTFLKFFLNLAFSI